ncbi:transmembrane protein 65 [Aplysia californica]|uniref:Transmembrane protein 65 n=1 Tax=Aplysia californica TaxID=6500 RepID=A0ABM1VVG3_APLCA|nr:transmembrane protein 65 [Aplysia californica]
MVSRILYTAFSCYSSKMFLAHTFQSSRQWRSFAPFLTGAKLSHRRKHTKPSIPPTRIMRLYSIHGAITDAGSAKEFVYALDKNERRHLYAELARFHGDEALSVSSEKPTRQQLKQVALHQALPFIGFGFLDNFLMIVAGEYIDVTLGAAFGISTMAAAAWGNLISDVGGLGSASYVESLASKVGVRSPHLSPKQVDMSSTKWASNMGKVVGVVIGCLLGMFPLLFFKDKEVQQEEEEGKTITNSGGST